MTTSLFHGYLVTVGILTLTPGPSVLLGSAHGMRYGARGTLPTIAGDLSANVLQMLAATLGLGVIVTQSATAFSVVKWGGVAYLAWMGIQQFRGNRKGNGGAVDETHLTPRLRYAQGFLTSASNPKAIVFFAALFPQFIDPSLAIAPQFLLLGISFLVLDGTSVLLYAASAGRVARWLGERRELQRRITGSVLLGAAALLSLKGVPTD